MSKLPTFMRRRLAAIMCADVVDYSRLMRTDEASALRLLAAHRSVTDRLISEYSGRIANTAGDSVVAEFPSSADAVQCALAIQENLAVSNEQIAEDRRMNFRIGVHVGEVMVNNGDILGDDVNVAARMQALAQPGTVCVTGAALDYLRGTLSVPVDDLGLQQVKNIPTPIRAYQLRPSGGPSPAIPPAHARMEAYLIRRCFQAVRSAVDKVAAPEGVSSLELGLLGSLADAPGSDYWQLAERLGVHPARSRRMVKHLQSMDLIKGATGSVVRRSQPLLVTAAGSELRQRVMPQIIAAQDRLMAPLSDPEREVLRDMLARIIKANDAVTGAHLSP